MRARLGRQLVVSPPQARHRSNIKEEVLPLPTLSPHKSQAEGRGGGLWGQEEQLLLEPWL